ncbi:MAG: hypothetical protein QOG26_1603, partial [Solirubrobacterales bacterium]|nr:hypothetical protein [Solirubrobacterales bacterium]
LDALHDLSFLPEQQRTALLLATIQELPHEEIAHVLGCPTAKVKSLVFRASRSLAERRLARETSCEEIRRRLEVLKRGSLRQNVVRWHLAECEGCRDYREQIRRERLGALSLLPLPLFAQRFLASALDALSPQTVGTVAGVAALATGVGAGLPIVHHSGRSHAPPSTAGTGVALVASPTGLWDLSAGSHERRHAGGKPSDAQLRDQRTRAATGMTDGFQLPAQSSDGTSPPPPSSSDSSGQSSPAGKPNQAAANPPPGQVRHGGDYGGSSDHGGGGQGDSGGGAGDGGSGSSSGSSGHGNGHGHEQGRGQSQGNGQGQRQGHGGQR